MKHIDQTIQEARNLARCIERAANFAETNLADFDCVCIHPDGHVHIYKEIPAKAAFGAEGWEVADNYQGRDLMQKVVDGVPLTFSRPVQHSFAPQLPTL